MIKLRQEINWAIRYKSFLSVLFVDIDNFKAYNDRHGHAAGDQLLEGVANVLTTRLRSIDIIARLGTGADEFVIVLPGDDYANALKTSDEIKKILATEKISVSIGVKQYKGQTIEKLLKAADAAMYEDKKNK